MKLHYTFFIWVVVLVAVAYFGFSTFPHSENFNYDFINRFANWDGGHYLAIAKVGYKDKFQYAFFPLFPLLIKALNNITENYLTAALVISVGSSFLAVRLLYKLVAGDFDKKIAEKTIIIMLLFPTSFYLLTAYSEGLFLFLSVATFYFSKKNKLLAATIFASAASATRLAGVAVILGFLAEVLIFKGLNKKNWYVILAPLGFIAYCWYLFSKTGDPFYFVTAENHWLRTISVPGLGFWESIKWLVSGQVSQNIGALMDFIFAVFGAGMVIRTFRFMPIAFSVYSLASVLLPFFTPSLTSLPRFILPIFPIFILMGFVKNQYIIFVYQLISVMLLGLFLTRFINGFWVA